MSRKCAVLAGLLGAIAGAIAGAPYLSHAGNCAEVGTPQLQCTLNSAVGPFASALAIGFVLAIAIAHGIAVLSRRWAAPTPARRPKRRAAVEVGDPYLQIAAWGLPPRASQRVIDIAPPANEQEGAPKQDGTQREPFVAWRVDELDPAAGTQPAADLLPEQPDPKLGSRGRPTPTPRKID